MDLENQRVCDNNNEALVLNGVMMGWGWGEGEREREKNVENCHVFF